MHRCIVVSRSDSANVESTVIGLDRTLRSEHHARGDGRLAVGVAHVEAFDAFGSTRQLEHVDQGHEAIVLGHPVRESPLKRHFGVLAGHLHPAGPMPAPARSDGHLAPAAAGHRVHQRVEPLELAVENDALWDSALVRQVVLGEKRFKDVLLGRSVNVARRARVAPEVLTVPDLQHFDDSDSFPAADRDHVDVALRTVDVLALLDPAEPRDLVAGSGPRARNRGAGTPASMRSTSSSIIASLRPSRNMVAWRTSSA